MDELVFLKLGGSLITDKRRRLIARTEIIKRLASEIAAARTAHPGLRLLIGHGSGSFGHPSAHQYHVREGNLPDWYGYAATSADVQQLDQMVINALIQEGLPAVAVQPSASACCRCGQLLTLEHKVIRVLLEHDAVPVVYGDVALDEQQGCTIISTEQIFSYLATIFTPQRVLIAGEVPGVMSANPQINARAQLIPELPFDLYQRFNAQLGDADGLDVTGGMASKVSIMFSLLHASPETSVRIISGATPGLVARVLSDPQYPAGTLLRL